MNDLQLIARPSSLRVAALKAPLPDVNQLAAFAAALGDATDGTAESQEAACSSLAGPLRRCHGAPGTARAFKRLKRAFRILRTCPHEP